MAGIAETFWAELWARLVADPEFGVPVERIRREHRTAVTRADSPAVQVIEGVARPTEAKRCDWQWEMGGSIAIFVRDDVGLRAADPLVAEIVRRINPEIGTPYSNGVRLELAAIEPETEIADEDATRVDLVLQVKFGTKRWTTDEAAA